jgi:hypothetical protein
VACIRRLFALCIRPQNVLGGVGYLDMLWPLLYSFSKLTLFHRWVCGFGALHRETILSLWRHSGQPYLSGTVRTNLLDASRWVDFPDESFAPVEKIVEVVLVLVEGNDMMDGKGVRISADQAWRRAVEVNGRNHYFVEMPEYCDGQMRHVMEATDVDGLALKKVMDSWYLGTTARRCPCFRSNR